MDGWQGHAIKNPDFMFQLTRTWKVTDQNAQAQGNADYLSWKAISPDVTSHNTFADKLQIFLNHSRVSAFTPVTPT